MILLLEPKEQERKRPRRVTTPALHTKEYIRSRQQIIIRRTEGH